MDLPSDVLEHLHSEASTVGCPLMAHIKPLCLKGKHQKEKQLSPILYLLISLCYATASLLPEWISPWTFSLFKMIMSVLCKRCSFTSVSICSTRSTKTASCVHRLTETQKCVWRMERGFGGFRNVLSSRPGSCCSESCQCNSDTDWCKLVAALGGNCQKTRYIPCQFVCEENIRLKKKDIIPSKHIPLQEVWS